jgi:uncharacterized membrane protein
MLKQFKYPLLLFLIGAFITIFGSWAKILHLAFADGVLTVGMLLQACGVGYALYVLVKTK